MWIFNFLCFTVKSLSKSVTPKNSSVSTSPKPETTEAIEPIEMNHDFTNCCVKLNVSSKCLGFCTIHKY